MSVASTRNILYSTRIEIYGVLPLTRLKFITASEFVIIFVDAVVLRCVIIKYHSLNHIRALEFIGILGISKLRIYRYQEKIFLNLQDINKVVLSESKLN